MTSCVVIWCERKPRKRGYCDAHHQRVLKGMDLDKPLRQVMRRSERPTQCTHSGCSNPHYASRLCRTHYHRRYAGRSMDNPRRYDKRVRGVSTKPQGKGYVAVWVPDHPAAFGAGYVMQHRYVMEQTLGRYLLPGENVHHLNGVRHDNRPENLELWASFQPSGQRPADLAQDARRLLGLYGTPEERTTYEEAAAPTLDRPNGPRIR